MARKSMEEVNIDQIDLSDELPLKEVVNTLPNNKETNNTEHKPKQLINCLRNERVVVRHIPKLSSTITNPKHVLFGGMAENAVKVFTVPRLSSGLYVNVLTDSEKDYLENIMGLEDNSLSIYKKQNNFWDDTNDGGISRVRLTKQDNYFNLSDPEDYIKYKILLANKDYIAPSLEVLQDKPKASYQFVIISEGDETKNAKINMSTTMKCYKEFGKIEEDADTLKVIIETIDGRPLSSTSKLEFLQTKANDLIQSDSKMFLKVITDPMLSTKVLIRKALESGIIAKRGTYLYLRSDNTPLCESGEEPTLNIAAKYLNNPKHQEIKFSIEAKLKV